MLRPILYIISKCTINYITQFFLLDASISRYMSHFLINPKLLLHIKYNAQIGKHSQKWGKEN